MSNVSPFLWALPRTSTLRFTQLFSLLFLLLHSLCAPISVWFIKTDWSLRVTVTLAGLLTCWSRSFLLLMMIICVSFPSTANVPFGSSVERKVAYQQARSQRPSTTSLIQLLTLLEGESSMKNPYNQAQCWGQYFRPWLICLFNIARYYKTWDL